MVWGTQKLIYAGMWPSRSDTHSLIREDEWDEWSVIINLFNVAERLAVNLLAGSRLRPTTFGGGMLN